MVFFLVITVLVSIYLCKRINMAMHQSLTCTETLLSKLFESVLSSVFDHWLTVDDIQYGFKNTAVVVMH